MHNAVWKSESRNTMWPTRGPTWCSAIILDHNLKHNKTAVNGESEG